MFEGYLPHQDRSSDDAPEIVLGYIAVRSESGASLMDGEPPADAAAYVSRAEDLEQAGQRCMDAGLTVEASSALGLSAHGHPDAWRRPSGAALVTMERLTHTGAGLVRSVTHVDVHGEGQPGELGMGATEDAVSDAVVLERPAVAMSLSPSPLPPNVSRFHLRVPDDVAVLSAPARRTKAATSSRARAHAYDPPRLLQRHVHNACGLKAAVNGRPLAGGGSLHNAT